MSFDSQSTKSTQKISNFFCFMFFHSTETNKRNNWIETRREMKKKNRRTIVQRTKIVERKKKRHQIQER